jgi:spermidine synthase
MAFIVLVMVFLSGFTGLVYQVTWQKYLSNYLGSHALSTSLTLSSFFFFLSIGYQLFGKYGHKLGKNRILVYAYVEGIIGVYAILSPALFSELYEVWPSYPSQSLAHLSSSWSFAFLLMGFPTFLMGGTIPLLTQGMSKKLQNSHKVHAYVYGLNTLGALVGILIAGFYLLEALGLEQSLNFTGIVNCLICVFLIFYCKLSAHDFSGFAPTASQEKPPRTHFLMLTLAFFSGFISFGFESLSIRMAGISIGSSNYTYTIIVASFIVSIAIGSFLAAKIKEEHCLRWLLISQIGITLSLFLLYFVIPNWPDYFLRVRLLFATSDLNFAPYWTLISLSFLVFLLVPVTLMGMTLPLLFQQLKSRGEFLNKTAGLMYAINSLGATLGAITIGYVVYFFLDGAQVFKLLILVASFTVILMLSLVFGRSKLAGLFFGVSILLIFFLPPWSDHSFVPSRFFSSIQPYSKQDLKNFLDQLDPQNKNREKVLFSDFGANTYVVVTEDKALDRTLYVNGKPDASTSGDRITRTLTALIPLTLSSKNEDIFIIGLGSGMSAGIATQFEGTKNVRVTEIASGVIKSLPYFSKWNFNLDESMEKVEIIDDDAYKVLKNENQKYDLIFSEPSNTWVSGVEKIYTREFLSQAAQKLRPHGLYSQWFPLFAMSEESFLSVLANFKHAFPHVTLWSGGGYATIILASHQPLEINMEELINKGQRMKVVYESVNKSSSLDLLAHQIWSDKAITDLARGAKISHSLYHPTLSYQSGRSFFNNSFVDHDYLAKKYFVSNESEETKKMISPIAEEITSSGDDQLLWEKFIDHLDLDFFERNTLLRESLPRVAINKLTLAMQKRYPQKDVEDSKEILRITQAKLSQVKYLSTYKPKFKPLMVKAETGLAQELFQRALFLLSLRENVYIENIFPFVPVKCGGEEKCLRIKLEIISLHQGLREKDKIALLQDLENDKDSTGSRLEEQWESMISEH